MRQHSSGESYSNLLGGLTMSTQTVSPSPTAQTVRATLHNLFPQAARAANAFADTLRDVQQHSLWTIEDQSAADQSEVLLKTIRLAHAVVLHISAFRLATVANPALQKVRTEDVDRSLRDMEQYAVRLSGVCRGLLAGDPLTPELLASHCNSLDGTLCNLQTEAQFFEAAIQQGTAAAA
jgi:hypothetical protein